MFISLNYKISLVIFLKRGLFFRPQTCYCKKCSAWFKRSVEAQHYI